MGGYSGGGGGTPGPPGPAGPSLLQKYTVAHTDPFPVTLRSFDSGDTLSKILITPTSAFPVGSFFSIGVTGNAIKYASGFEMLDVDEPIEILCGDKFSSTLDVVLSRGGAALTQGSAEVEIWGDEP